MAPDLFESFFDFDGDGKLTVDDDLLFLWMMENENDAEPKPAAYSPRVKKSDRMLADLCAKNLALAEQSVRKLSENVQTIFDRSGVIEKTGSQAVAELTAAFAFLSLAVSKASLSDKAALFDRMTACCRFGGSPVPAGSGLFTENCEGIRQQEIALIHEDLTLILQNINDGSDAAEEFFSVFSVLLLNVEACAAANQKDFRFEKTPDQLFLDCALIYLKKARAETSAEAAALPEARVLKRLLKQKRRILITSVLLSTVTFLALSGLPCLLIWAFFSTLLEGEDLTGAAALFLLFVVLPLVFVVLLARTCFQNLSKEFREYADVRQAIRERDL